MKINDLERISRFRCRTSNETRLLMAHDAHRPMDYPGNLIVVAAPSGAGKSSLVKALQELDAHIHPSISHTTRAPRGQEKHGREYFFASESEFDAMVQAQAFVEWAHVHGKRYGTSKKAIEERIAQGSDVILEIDFQGALQIRQAFANAVLVFILPPGWDELRSRLERRGEDSAEVIEMRLKNAAIEMAHVSKFDFVIINELFERALFDLKAVVHAQRLKYSAHRRPRADTFESLHITSQITPDPPHHRKRLSANDPQPLPPRVGRHLPRPHVEPGPCPAHRKPQQARRDRATRNRRRQGGPGNAQKGSRLRSSRQAKPPPKQRHHSGAGPGPEIVDPLPHCITESLNVVPPPICAPQPRPDPAPAQDGAAPAAVAAANAAAASFTALTSRLDYLDAASIEQVRQAYRFADEAHLGQLRDSGEPYITPPIAVAAQCTAWKLDAQALMAALLHDAMEDCDVTKANLIDRFGAPVAELVDGLTKLDPLPIITREENQAKSFRKMLLATARDVRVILIKLADRTHNMRTLSDTPRSKWARISMETLEIYAPSAHRLGLDQTYRELQDLAFRHLHPWRHATLDKAVSKLRNTRRRDLLQKVQTEVSAAFTKIGMKVSLTGREKTLYAIYQKMKLKHLGFLQVTDLYGFRIIVPTVTDCYTALGVLHQMYQPVPGRFKDYIAIAKPNGYQSLYTTLVGPSGVNIEFQMRTDAMHAIAESGMATHWLYKSQDTEGISAEHLDTHQWLQSLLDIQT